ncbi:hypothetical protein [Pseudomonas abieticivorans]|uniref:hypothetical protein n=1 Tax=Pseudomonas abieticivorans TaxID=2931382 RepID=UPI0020BF4D33|nr:hypothetical protein [Pseudomonas sp. PIA16]
MSNIKIEINVGPDESSCSVKGSGSGISTVSSGEAMGLSNDLFVGAIGGQNVDQGPNIIHWNHPLHKEKNYQLPCKHIKVIDCAIDSIRYRPTILKTATFDNVASNTAATYDTRLKQEVTQTVESSWSSSRTLEQSLSVSYEIGFGLSAEASLSYSKSWEESHTKSRAIALASEAGVSVTINPGDKKVASLSAYQGTLILKVRYLTTYMGTVIGEYNRPNQFLKFSPFDISWLYMFDDEDDAIITTETIEVGFYSRVHVTLSDA